LFSNQNSKFGKILEGIAMEDVGTFYGNLVHFKVFWYILLAFGIFYWHLVYFIGIWYILLAFGIFYWHFVYFIGIWYIFPFFGFCTMKNQATLLE
jgi:hypothetical protein